MSNQLRLLLRVVLGLMGALALALGMISPFFYAGTATIVLWLVLAGLCTVGVIALGPKSCSSAVFACLAIGLVAATFICFLPTGGSPKWATLRTACLSNMKQLNTAMMEYAADYNDRLPPASHWRDLISEHWSPHHQESHELNTICCPMNRSKPSYAMNQALSGFRTKLIEQPQDVVLLFDATGSSLNLSGGPNSLRVRHRDHATVGFADGSAKSLEMGHLGTLRRLPTMSK